MAISPATIIAHLKATSRALASGAVPLDVSIVDGAGNQVTSFGGSGGTSATDSSAFTVTSGSGTPMMGIYESSPSSLSDGQVGVVGLTATRAVKVSGSLSTSPQTASTSTLSNVSESASNVTVLAANAARIGPCGASFYNDSDSAVNLKRGATASATSFTKRLLPREFWVDESVYTGKYDAIWDTTPGTSGHAAMRVNELTP